MPTEVGERYGSLKAGVKTRRQNGQGYYVFLSQDVGDKLKTFAYHFIQYTEKYEAKLKFQESLDRLRDSKYQKSFKNGTVLLEHVERAIDIVESTPKILDSMGEEFQKTAEADFNDVARDLYRRLSSK